MKAEGSRPQWSWLTRQLPGWPLGGHAVRPGIDRLPATGRGRTRPPTRGGGPVRCPGDRRRALRLLGWVGLGLVPAGGGDGSVRGDDGSVPPGSAAEAAAGRRPRLRVFWLRPGAAAGARAPRVRRAAAAAPAPAAAFAFAVAALVGGAA